MFFPWRGARGRLRAQKKSIGQLKGDRTFTQLGGRPHSPLQASVQTPDDVLGGGSLYCAVCRTHALCTPGQGLDKSGAVKPTLLAVAVPCRRDCPRGRDPLSADSDSALLGHVVCTAQAPSAPSAPPRTKREVAADLLTSVPNPNYDPGAPHAGRAVPSSRGLPQCPR